MLQGFCKILYQIWQGGAIFGLTENLKLSPFMSIPLNVIYFARAIHISPWNQHSLRFTLPEPLLGESRSRVRRGRTGSWGSRIHQCVGGPEEIGTAHHYVLLNRPLLEHVEVVWAKLAPVWFPDPSCLPRPYRKTLGTKLIFARTLRPCRKIGRRARKKFGTRLYSSNWSSPLHYLGTFYLCLQPRLVLQNHILCREEGCGLQD